MKCVASRKCLGSLCSLSSNLSGCLRLEGQGTVLRHAALNCTPSGPTCPIASVSSHPLPLIPLEGTLHSNRTGLLATSNMCFCPRRECSPHPLPYAWLIPSGLSLKVTSLERPSLMTELSQAPPCPSTKDSGNAPFTVSAVILLAHLCSTLQSAGFDK